MKKFMMFLCLAFIVGYSNGQTIVVSLADEIIEGMNYFCADTLIIHGDSTCQWVYYDRPGVFPFIEVHSYELVVTENENQGEWVFENPCDDSSKWFYVYLSSPSSNAFNPFDAPFVWKRVGDMVTLGNPEMTYADFQWSTGETSTTIDVVEDGIYSVEINDPCGPRTYSIQVRDNVELFRATVDLATGLNKVTWQTTPEQTEYISQVKVERDGFVVGTAPYTDGQFIDNIGSENAARNYRLTAITTEGDECPIPSYQYGTLHVDFSPNASNPNKLNMAWTAPFIEEGAPLTVTYFQICKYDPNTGEVTVVDQIGANNTIGSYDVNLFDGGYATVAAVFSRGRDYEELSFSNLTDEVLEVGENAGKQFIIYPNPAHGVLFVETRRATSLPAETEYRITNLMGQTLLQGIINAEQSQIDVTSLPEGMYFLSIDGTSWKFVVE